MPINQHTFGSLLNFNLLEILRVDEAAAFEYNQYIMNHDLETQAAKEAQSNR